MFPYLAPKEGRERRGAAVKKLLQNEERTRLSPYYTNMSTETEAGCANSPSQQQAAKVPRSGNLARVFFLACLRQFHVFAPRILQAALKNNTCGAAASKLPYRARPRARACCVLPLPLPKCGMKKNNYIL